MISHLTSNRHREAQVQAEARQAPQHARSAARKRAMCEGSF